MRIFLLLFLLTYIAILLCHLERSIAVEVLRPHGLVAIFLGQRRVVPDIVRKLINRMRMTLKGKQNE